MRILLVEDEPDVRTFLVRALGYVVPASTVVQAVDGEEALALFSPDGFDLVLSDHRMPRLTGLELLRAIRAISAVPFVLISADRSITNDAYAAGVSEFLNKPLSLAALRSTVLRFVGP